MKVVITDDQPLAQDILEHYVGRIPGLQLAAKCKNALELYRVLQTETIDLVLLDIDMPEISGMDFLRSLKNPPRVIFTTAYSEYAVESYTLQAVDYLLKPIAFDRFLTAIDKARSIIQEQAASVPVPVPISPVPAPATQDGPGIIFVKSEGKLIKIDLEQVWFIEGLKDYVRFHSATGRTIVHTTMKNLEEQLAHLPDFLRVHRSFIVNFRFISEIWGNSIKIGDQSVTIGNTYQEEVFRRLEKYKLQ